MKARILSLCSLGCLALLSAVLALSCKIPGSSSPSAATASIPSVFLTDYNGDFNYSLNVGSEAKNVYFVFSNTDVNMSADAVTVKNSVGKIKVNGVEIASSCAQPAGGPSATSTKAKDFLARSNRDIISTINSGGIKVSGSAVSKSGVPSLDTVGDTGSLYDLNASDNLSAVAAHCRYVSPAPVSTNQGQRTLNVWVADNCINPADPDYSGGTGVLGTGTGQVRHFITKAMVDALAAKFLSAGLDNDIFDWDTNILGPEWGTPQGQYASQLIPFNGEITILLSDIEQDNSDNGGVVGYFWDGNNFKSSYSSGSNQRIMFVIDAVMYANPNPSGASSTGGSGWDPTYYWPEECFSTLAHEFQHMIQFYRKGVVVRGDCQSADTWINEMCSQLVEDLVARKMAVNGPRGVDPSVYTSGSAGAAGNKEGRIPYFNEYLSSYDRQLTKTDNYDVLDYSFSYAFGAWLVRNYGGTDFVKNVVYGYALNSDCVTGAVNSYSGQSMSIGDLISRWAIAVLGSDRTDMPLGYRYNTGGWTSSSASGTTYDLGSIDFFNYSPTPQMLSGSATSSQVAASSNVYYAAAAGLTGIKDWKLSLPTGVSFGVYVTP